jgi:hypothetical protein
MAGWVVSDQAVEKPQRDVSSLLIHGGMASAEGINRHKGVSWCVEYSIAASPSSCGVGVDLGKKVWRFNCLALPRVCCAGIGSGQAGMPLGCLHKRVDSTQDHSPLVHRL